MADIAGIIYTSRAIDFGGIQRIIAYPANHHERSALLALYNALSLRGDLTVPQEAEHQVPLQSLVSRLQRKYRRSHLGLGGGDVITRIEMNNCITALSRAINVSVDFTKSDGITSNTVNLEVFEHLKVSLHHGRIVDHENEVVANAIGVGPHEVFRAADPDAPIQIINEDQEVVNLPEVVEFLQGTGLTDFGLQQLIESAQDEQVFVLFWNRSFHTMIKHDGNLYALHNYMDNISTNIVWREFNLQGEGQFFTSNFVLVSAAVLQAEAVVEAAEGGVPPQMLPGPDQSGSSSPLKAHQCNRRSCQHVYLSEVNLNRHKQIHSKDPKVTIIGFNKDEIGKFWDKLNNKDACIITSIMDMRIQDIHGDLLCELIEQTAPEDIFYGIANKLKDTLAGKEKISSSELFALLDEGSERTAFSTDIRHLPKKVLSCEMGVLALKETSNVIACWCFFLEKRLIDDWSNYMDAESTKFANLLLDGDKDSRFHICPNPGCELRFFSQVNYNRHMQTHIEDPNGKDFVEKRTQIGEYFDKLITSDSAGPVLSLDQVNIKSFKWKTVKKLLKKEQNPLVAGKLLDAINTKKTTADELFAALDKASEGTLFTNDVLSCEDSKIFKECIPTPINATAAVSYFLEKNLIERWFKSNATNKIDLLGQTAGQQHKQRL
ncbi:hypothetical protein SETIT_7G057400v2 [Setaria italica]|uniref:C2H2-type domain-containing protein n=1 Tax=Setaria italica TaxID=4555 RepID=A0A368RSA5_SETIT|nr:uncharacterized protein LOC101775331 isoform X3 [Setaria italica]RCV33127.1 hypothetical protein SETIT_7G057400v2 [Setaria italica]